MEVDPTEPIRMLIEGLSETDRARLLGSLGVTPQTQVAAGGEAAEEAAKVEAEAAGAAPDSEPEPELEPEKSKTPRRGGGKRASTASPPAAAARAHGSASDGSIAVPSLGFPIGRADN